MYCNTCESNPCTCQRKASPGPRETAQPIPYGISKEDFGLNLYEVIKTIGGLLAIDQHRAVAIHRGEPQSSLLARRKDLQVALAQQLPTLNDSEMAQVLARYPWITGC